MTTAERIDIFRAPRISRPEEFVEITHRDRGLVGKRYISVFDIGGVRVESHMLVGKLIKGLTVEVQRYTAAVYKLEKHDIDLTRADG